MYSYINSISSSFIALFTLIPYLYLLAITVHSSSVSTIVIGIRVGIRVVISLKKLGLKLRLKLRLKLKLKLKLKIIYIFSTALGPIECF